MTGHNLPVDRSAVTGGGWYYPPEARRFVNRPTRL